jgi:hypothetical protein
MALNPNLNNYNHILKLRQNITKSRLNSINTKTNVREKQKIEQNMTSKPETDLDMNSNYSIPYESLNDMKVEMIQFFH